MAVELRKKDPKPFGNIAAGVYGVQKQKVTIGKGDNTPDVIDILSTEPIDFKDFEELKAKTRDIAQYNLEALTLAKEQKKEYFIQKVLVTL